jgi:GNAT superfamily N-acetyltransferase
VGLPKRDAALTSRILPPHEWPRLACTELEAVYPHLNPDDADVVVVEDDGRVVACWALLRVYHVEGVWVHPDYRKRGRVAGRLLEAMRGLCKRLKIGRVVTAAQSDDVRQLIVHLRGQVLPGDHFVIPLEGR